MIEGDQYIKRVNFFFSFLNTEFRFRLYEEKVRGNVFYDVRFKNETKIISVSYENIEDYFEVVVFKLQNGEMPDYDDKVETLHLRKLNEAILSTVDKNEINLNKEYFREFKVTDELDRKLLKSAKELRLCLKYFNDIKSI